MKAHLIIPLWRRRHCRRSLPQTHLVINHHECHPAFHRINQVKSPRIFLQLCRLMYRQLLHLMYRVINRRWRQVKAPQIIPLWRQRQCRRSFPQIHLVVNHHERHPAVHRINQVKSRRILPPLCRRTYRHLLHLMYRAINRRWRQAQRLAISQLKSWCIHQQHIRPLYHQMYQVNLQVNPQLDYHLICQAWHQA